MFSHTARVCDAESDHVTLSQRGKAAIALGKPWLLTAIVTRPRLAPTGTAREPPRQRLLDQCTPAPGILAPP